MFYVYVLISLKTNQLYTGYTNNLRERIEQHNKGKGGYFTERNKPYKLIFYEAFLSKSDALKQEKFYKTGYGKEVLKGKIVSSLNSLRR